MEDHATTSSYSYSSSLPLLLLILSTSYGYCYFFVKKLPKGLPRLLSLLGIFYTFFHIPWYFPSSILLRGVSSFFLSWISSFKLLLFSFDKGDLINCDNYLEFVLVASLPLRIKPQSSSPSRSSSFLQETLSKLLTILFPFFLVLSFHEIALILTIVAILFVSTVSIVSIPRDDSVYLHKLWSKFVKFDQRYLNETFIMRWRKYFDKRRIVILPHLEVVPILNQPHKATSLKVFWGKRWNRISSDILRHTIYDPTREMLSGLVGSGSGSASVIALVVTLVVSGIMHEIMFYHMTCGMKPTWEVTQFFVLQGICMAIEGLIKRSWVRTLGWAPISPIISVPLTLSFLLATSYWLLVLPVMRITERGCHRSGFGMKLMEKCIAYFYSTGDNFKL